jgi:beta-glucosidase
MPIAPGATPNEIEARIEELVAELSLEEKIPMLSGHGFFEQIAADGGRYCASLYHIGAGNDRLGIPKLLFMDGPRGIGMGASTCFPVSMARGASFDVDLERRIGDAIGRELRAYGGNLFGGVCINLLRHPAWGRAQETYGEDPFLLGEMGVALTRGVQHHNVVATPKHFACNSMENARFKVDVRIDERALREVYLPHFEKCIAAGAGAVMSAYNKLNGAYCGHNTDLLTSILKDEWGFDGFVYSDFVLGCRGEDAMAAGLDVEAPGTIHFGDKLLAAVERGEIARSRIDDAVRRVLRSLLRTLVREDPEAYGPEAIACDAHVALAREAAEKSIVLLKNDGVLPLDPATTKRVLVLGPLADMANLGDHGSSRVYPPQVVTVLDGLRDGAPEGCEVVHDDGHDLDRVRRLCSEADAVLVVAGYTHRNEGEYIPPEMNAGGDATGGDRLELGLGPDQEALILAAATAQPNTIVAVMAGSAVMMEGWRHEAAGVLMLWYPGMQGGRALADIVTGRVDPSGRLPFTIPANEGDLPFFDREAEAIEYGLLHGYTKLEAEGVAPAYPFGFGLGYTDFELSSPQAHVDAAADAIEVEVGVRNIGSRPGVAVVQVYAGPAHRQPDEPIKRLCAFERVEVPAGDAGTARMRVGLRDLARFDVKAHCWKLTPEPWQIHVGSSSADSDLQAISIQLPARTWSLAAGDR